jgi:hypothetical protein
LTTIGLDESLTGNFLFFLTFLLVALPIVGAVVAEGSKGIFKSGFFLFLLLFFYF